MGLLTETKPGLLNKVVLPPISVDPINVPQGGFNIPQYETKPKAPTLTGPTKLSQGKVTPIDKVKTLIPQGFSGDVVRGVIDAPVEATKFLFSDEENIVKLDRLAQSLVEKGTDPTRAYEIAGHDMQKSSLDFNQSKGANEKYKTLQVTPEEEDSLKKARLTNAFMTGLAVSNFTPIGGIAKNIGETIIKIGAEKDATIIAKHLKDLGVPKEKIPTLATTLSGVSKPEVVNDLIKGAITEPKAGLLNKPVEPQKYQTIHQGNKIKEVEGEPITIVDGVDTFVHKDEIGNWVVSEKTTGRSLTAGGYENKNFAIKAARDNVFSVGEENFKKRITEKQLSTETKETVNPLLEEAKKYKSAEEFSKSVQPLDTPNVYIHQTDAKNITKFRGKEAWVAPDDTASYGEHSLKVYAESKKPFDLEVPENQYLYNTLGGEANPATFDELRKRGYDSVIETNGDRAFLYPDRVKVLTDKYLTDLYNQAKGVTRTPEELAIAKEKLTKKTETRPAKESKVSQSLEGQTRTSLEENAPSRPTSYEVPNLTKTQAKSLEKSNYQKLVESSLARGEDTSSLLKTLSRPQTPVNRKINTLDYLRTPDRVLKKIGLEKEAQMLREGHEAYLKELPKNIEKITEWSKRVPPEASERIFKYLDGEKIALEGEELTVAHEIKDWLKEWADRLKLPEDNRLANYITHLFDDELVAKEFDEDLAKIIADKIPGSVYDPFLQKRLGALGYKQDVWSALDAYVKRGTRKANMDDALEATEEAASALENSQWDYVKDYIDRINMRPTKFDNIVDNGLKSLFGYKLGQRPTLAITRFLRQMTYRAKLGANLSSALRNLSQGVNTYAKLGEKYTAIGYMKLLSPESFKELVEQGVLVDNFIEDRVLSSTKKALQKIDKGLFIFFDTAEKINRGSAYFGAKAKALNEGKTLEEAIQAGKKMVRDTQFQFSAIDTPVGLQSDIVKTLTQFQSYTTKQIEFLAEMAKDKNFVGLMRYALAGTAFVYTLGQAFGMKEGDLLPWYRFDTPASLKLITEGVKALADAPDKYGADRSTDQKIKDVAKEAFGIIPGSSQIKKTYEGAKLVKEGGSFDKGGNLQYEAPTTTASKVQSVLFGKSPTEKAQTYYNREEQAQKDEALIRPLYDKVQKLVAEGKEAEADELIDSLGDKGYDVYKKIRAAERAKATKEAKNEFLPTYREIRKAIEEGRTEDADVILDGLTDDEYKYYQAWKKQLEGEYIKSSQKPSIGDQALSALGVETASASELPLLGEKGEPKYEEPYLKSNLNNGQGTYSVRGVDFDERDVSELEAVLYGEIGNRPGKRELEAQTILNIIINRAKKSGKSIREILKEPKQFQAYGGKEYKVSKGKKVDAKKMEEIRKVIEMAKKGTLKNNVGEDMNYAHLADNTIRSFKDWSEQEKNLAKIK